MIGESRTWVTTFDGALARVWAADEDGRLHERSGDGLDARENSEAMREGGRGEGQPDLHRPGYVARWSEPRFVEHFAQQLAERARQGQFDRLVVAAEPQALGYFRDSAPDELKSRIVAETPKDYVHASVKQIEQALAEHLRF
jgi:protein required for attachment to host cells